VKRLRLPGVTPLEIWNTKVWGAPLFGWQRTDRFSEALREVVRGYDRIVVMGGGAFLVDLPGAIVVDDPRFAAARAGSDFVGGGLCVDVGQTAIKSVSDRKVWLRERDERVHERVRESIGAPALLALPCAVDDECHLGPCTYDFDDELFADLDCLVLNDAELATLAAPPGPALVLTIGYGVGAALKR
jgi:hypothetical protein